MGLLTNTARNLALEALDESVGAGARFFSAHTAWPGTSGTAELTGGSPAYARKAATWNAAASGSKALNAAVTIDVPALTTVKFTGLWDALTAGNFLGIGIPGSGGLKVATTVDTAGETIQCPGHGFVNGDQVVVVQVGSLGLPGGLVEGTTYFVINATSDALQVSLTSGGAAVNITGVGSLFLSRIVPEAFTGQGQFTIASATIDELLT